MPQFQHIYTGKDTGVTLPSGERLDRAQDKMSEMIISADKLRFESFQKNEAWFLKTSDLPVESYLSTASTEYQAKLLDEYNNKSIAIVKARGGMDKLTTEDKLELVKGKQFVQGEQQRMLGDQEKYKMAKQVVQRNKDYYDEGKFDELMMGTLFKDGRYPDAEELPIRAKSIDEDLSSHPVYGSKSTTVLKPVEGNPDKEVPYEYSATKEEVARVIAGKAFSNPQYLEEVKQDWESLSEQDKNKYLDPDGDGVKQYKASENMKDLTNPLLMNYIDKHWQSGVKSSAGAPQYKKRSTGRGMGLSFNIGGADLIVSPAVKRDVPVIYGDKTYTDSYAFGGNTTLSNLPTLGGIRYKGTSTKEMKKGNITGKLKDYLPNEDLIIIEAATGIPELGVETKGLVGIPASQIEGVENLPIIKDGKQVNIGMIRGKGITTPIKSGVNWKTPPVTKGMGVH